MTDVSKQILEKANGGLKLNPDEQRTFSLVPLKNVFLATLNLLLRMMTNFKRHF